MLPYDNRGNKRQAANKCILFKSHSYERELTVDGTRESVSRRYLCKHRSRFTETRTLTARGCPCKFTDCVHHPASVIRPHATLGFEEALGAVETRRSTINTTEKARVPVREARLRAEIQAENADWIRAFGKSMLRDKVGVFFSLSRKSRKSSGHAPRMISQSGLPCSVHCLPVCSIYKTLTGKRG